MTASELAVQATASGITRIYEDGQNAFGKAFDLLNSQLLPALGKGVTISAEYFHDLAGRYVTYLTIYDALFFFLPLVPLFFVPALYRISKNTAEKSREYDADFIHAIRVTFGSVICFVLILFSLNGLFDLVKDLTIPELRVYEELSSLYKRM